MAIQFERRQWEPHRPPRKNEAGIGNIHKFWNPQERPRVEHHQQVPWEAKMKPKAKTPQPSRKIHFWESKKESSLMTTSSKSMVSLVPEAEVDEKRGFTPSDVAKDPAKREFLTTLSKKIFSPADQASNGRRLSRNHQLSRSFRVWTSMRPPTATSFHYLPKISLYINKH